MPNDAAPLSRVEWTIMNICWELGEAPARYVFERSLKEKKRDYRTVKTMLDRLVAKGYLARRKLGAIGLYKPVLPKMKVRSKAIESFVENVLENAMTPLLLHFVESESLDEEDITLLEELIKKYKGK